MGNYWSYYEIVGAGPEPAIPAGLTDRLRDEVTNA